MASSSDESVNDIGDVLTKMVVVGLLSGFKILDDCDDRNSEHAKKEN